MSELRELRATLTRAQDELNAATARLDALESGDPSTTALTPRAHDRQRRNLIVVGALSSIATAMLFGLGVVVFATKPAPAPPPVAVVVEAPTPPAPVIPPPLPVVVATIDPPPPVVAAPPEPRLPHRPAVPSEPPKAPEPHAEPNKPIGVTMRRVDKSDVF